ncbi:uncharacterized protein ARMOST_18462 [Armillaria ostoyae]|uniref:Uncharacterized protein n=1 Tax=Armillaria ostoyae TaxID=47428 RepID=A0A284S1Y3_ARMOS|nr:uncharacterized protein ARMOST_18462 [Armillaria ostoyae]
MNVNYGDIKFVVGEEVALRNLEHRHLCDSRLIMVQSRVSGTPRRAYRLCARRYERDGCITESMVQLWTRRFPNSYATLFPTISKHPRRRVSKISDVAKAQPFSVHPAKLSSGSEVI